MKKLLVVATLSITVAAVIKRVAKKESRVANVRVSNISELIGFLDSAMLHARHLDSDLKMIKQFKPKVSAR